MSRSLVVVALAALLLTLVPVAHAQLLSQEQGITVDGATVDRFTWIDAAGLLRSGSLAHNNVQDPTGNFGGKLWQYTYVLPGPTTRTVRAAQTSGASGFGYVVSHANDLTNCLGDDSPLGHAFAGTFTRLFSGRHHAIFRFQQNYPRNCTAPPALPATHQVPVTIDWVFSTGWDNPLWSVTWDLSGVPAGLLNDDSRAPYGELLFDGSATEGAHSQITGVEWGDRYLFFSTTNPVTYDSGWDYSLTNRVPYVKLYTTNPEDATMGTVQTQTIQQHDAAGYFGFTAWGSNSAGFGNACAANEEFAGSAAHLMPCSFNWSYQSINFSMGEPGGGANNVGTNNTRLAWGAPFGFLGQTTYDVTGSVNQGGPVGNGVDPTFGSDSPTASGHPKNSYSVFVVLGQHTQFPVETQRFQIENVQQTTLSASVGTVLTSGAAGVNRTDTVTYQPAGWDHVYAGWRVQAGGTGAVDMNWSMGVMTQLRNPLVIISNWTTGLPSAVRFNGTTLLQDIQYFPSLRTDRQELWLTLDEFLNGPNNRLEIDPGSGPPPPPPGSGSFFTLTPCRVADTRGPDGPTGGPVLSANTTRDFPAAGICGIPSDATAIAINVTVVEETNVGDLRLYGAGGAVPSASTINFTANHVRANNAIIPLGTGGQISVQCDMPAGTTQFLFDVTGYFK
jgi:hypothetical protein